MEPISLKQINKRLETIPSDFYQEVLNYLDFLSFKTNITTHKKYIDEIKNSLNQINQIKNGKLPKKTAKDFLNGL